MAFLESASFCSLEQYQSSLAQRVHETALQANELFMLALRLSGDNKHEAAKFPVRSKEIVRKTGLAVIQFTFLDNDLNPINESTAQMRDGIVNQVQGALVVDPATREEFKILEGHFKDYFDDQFGGVLVESQEQTLVGTAG